MPFIFLCCQLTATMVFARVPLPPGYPIGVVIGTCGANIKRLQEESGGAKIAVNPKKGAVSISGSFGQVEAARGLVEAQIAAYLRTGM